MKHLSVISYIVHCCFVVHRSQLRVCRAAKHPSSEAEELLPELLFVKLLDFRPIYLNNFVFVVGRLPRR